MNRNKIIKVCSGVYQYKGYEIDRIDNDNGTVNHWNITKIGELIAHDAAQTKREAMSIIDDYPVYLDIE
jgi:hypothetical protein